MSTPSSPAFLVYNVNTQLPDLPQPSRCIMSTPSPPTFMVYNVNTQLPNLHVPQPSWCIMSTPSSPAFLVYYVNTQFPSLLGVLCQHPVPQPSWCIMSTPSSLTFPNLQVPQPSWCIMSTPSSPAFLVYYVNTQFPSLLGVLCQHPVPQPSWCIMSTPSSLTFPNLQGSRLMDDTVLKVLGTGTVVATAAAYWLTRSPPNFNPAVDFTEQTYNALNRNECKHGPIEPIICHNGLILMKYYGSYSDYKTMGGSASAFTDQEALRHQSTNIQGPEKAKISKQAEKGVTVAYDEEDVRTLHDAFKKGARISNNGPCLGWKPSPTEPYNWISYNDVTELSLIICDKNEKVTNLLGRMSETPNLRILVVMETITDDVKALAQKHSVDLIQYSDLEDDKLMEPLNIFLFQPSGPDDLAVVCYTSGTTGLPKGAMLTHENCLAPTLACTNLFDSNNLIVKPDDVLISYLPLAHSYERLCEACMYSCGGKIGFFQGDVRKLMDDIKELKPTVFPSVPRLLNRVFDKVMAGASVSAIKSKMLNMALASKEAEIKSSHKFSPKLVNHCSGIIRKNSWWDKLVFSKIQESLGGRVRLLTTGSAPLSPKILMFLRCCVGAPVLEGYGQTECGAICTLQVPGDGQIDDKGEVCIKGPNVFKGYIKDPVKTQEAIDEDGWLHTGDVGQWMDNGCLKIIDRKKNIFKLAQGEYIAPEKIENVYVRSPHVAQSSLIAVIVPDPDTFPAFARDKLGLSGDMAELCNNEQVKKVIMEDITSVGKKAGLASFEQAKAIHLYPELFSVENELLTPTFKSKRNTLKVFFKKEIEEMYKDLP
ncbi:ACSL5-like protein [Mya arenaria]|uniref:long-chain-fatty-acid--CoA ligase n=1 Tax=Mya arenaria TaxID=6604 RepID=A0ABY7DLV0_MYAAR|nr:ACSL5-like protein [Mya arenaria]